MIQIATTLEQSKKLVELGFSGQTADMSYMYDVCKEQDGEPVKDWKLQQCKCFDLCGYPQIPAWSLSALWELLPNAIETEDYEVLELNISKDINQEMEICYYTNDRDFRDVYHGFTYKNPFDAIVTMLEFLKNEGLI